MIESLDELKAANKWFHIYGKLEAERRAIFKITELYLKAWDVEPDPVTSSPLARCVNQIAYDAVSKGEYVQEARGLLERALSWIEQEAEFDGPPADAIRKFLYPTGDE